MGTGTLFLVQRGTAKLDQYGALGCVDTAAGNGRQFHETAVIFDSNDWAETFAYWPGILASSVQADYGSPQVG